MSKMGKRVFLAITMVIIGSYLAVLKDLNSYERPHSTANHTAIKKDNKKEAKHEKPKVTKETSKYINKDLKYPKTSMTMYPVKDFNLYNMISLVFTPTQYAFNEVHTLTWDMKVKQAPERFTDKQSEADLTASNMFEADSNDITLLINKTTSVPSYVFKLKGHYVCIMEIGNSFNMEKAYYAVSVNPHEDSFREEIKASDLPKKNTYITSSVYTSTNMISFCENGNWVNKNEIPENENLPTDDHQDQSGTFAQRMQEDNSSATTSDADSETDTGDSSASSKSDSNVEHKDDNQSGGIQRQRSRSESQSSDHSESDQDTHDANSANSNGNQDNSEHAPEDDAHENQNNDVDAQDNGIKQ